MAPTLVSDRHHAAETTEEIRQIVSFFTSEPLDAASEKALYLQGVAFISALNIPDPQIFYANLNQQNKKSLRYIVQAVQTTNIPITWNDRFFDTLCEHFDILYLAASSLSMHFKMVKKLALAAGGVITPMQGDQIDRIIARGKRMQDDKMPISKPLLEELCAAADKIFERYDALLAKSMFLAAWGAFMRVSEYTTERNTSRKKKRKRDHNVASESVDIEDDGFGITFESDKTSNLFTSPRHRVIQWSFFPAGARQIFDSYLSVRPKGARKFFVKMDGQPLTRNEFCDILDSSLLLTRWRSAHCVPHSFRVGGASHARKIGMGILEVQYIGRWTKNSSAIEAYTRPDLLNIEPEELKVKKPKYIRAWTFRRLRFLAQNVIQTKGSRLHPFHVMLKQDFPRFMSACEHLLPKNYPSIKATNRLAQQWRDRLSGTFLKKHKLEYTKKMELHKRRTKLSKEYRRSAVNRAKSFHYGRVLKLNQIREVPGDTASVAIQTDNEPVTRASVAVQASTVTRSVDAETQSELIEMKETLFIETPGDFSTDQETLLEFLNAPVTQVVPTEPSEALQVLSAAAPSALEVEGQEGLEEPIVTIDLSQINTLCAEVDLHMDNTMYTYRETSPASPLEGAEPADTSQKTLPGETEDEPPPLFGPYDTPNLEDRPASTLSSDDEDSPLVTEPVTLGFADSDKTIKLLPHQMMAIQRRQRDPGLVKDSFMGFSGEISKRTEGTDYALQEFFKDPTKIVSSRDSFMTRQKTRLQMRFSKYRGKAALHPRYRAEVDGKMCLLSSEEFKAKFPGRKLPVSVAAKINSNINRKIRRRLSTKFRRYMDTQNQRARELVLARKGNLGREPIPLPKVPRLTGSMEALIDIYFDGVYHEGDKALPARVDDSDSEHSSEEFFYKHMNEPTDAELAEARATDPEFAEKMDGLVRKRKKAQHDHRQEYLKQWGKEYYIKNKEMLNAKGKAHRQRAKEQKALVRAQWKQKYYETCEKREQEHCEKLLQARYGDRQKKRSASEVTASSASAD